MGEGRLLDCVKERRWTPDRRSHVEVWHVARHRGRTQDFTPIRCSYDEGIVLPGPIERRSPTCPDCAALAARPSPLEDPE